MTYADFNRSYKTVLEELDEAERIEGSMLETDGTNAVSRGEYIRGSIMYLGKYVRRSDHIEPHLINEINHLETRYRKLAERDRVFYRGLLGDLKISLNGASLLLERAKRQYFFFSGKTDEGYPYEQLISDFLFRMESAAERLRGTGAFARLKINIGLVKDDLEQILQGDERFREIVCLN